MSVLGLCVLCCALVSNLAATCLQWPMFWFEEDMHLVVFRAVRVIPASE